MANKKEEKISKFENSTIVKLKANNRQIRLLSRHDRKESVYISWYFEYVDEDDLDSNLIVREDEIYSDD